MQAFEQEGEEMSEFTKGPWFVVKGDYYACVKSNRGVVCDARLVNSTIPNVDDLSLIAAAPDLYEALEACLHEVMTGGSRQYKNAVAALAKARGNEQ